MTLTVQQAADKIGITIQMLRRHITSGNLIAKRHGHMWAIESSDLATFRRFRRSRGRPKIKT